MAYGVPGTTKWKEKSTLRNGNTVYLVQHIELNNYIFKNK